MALFNKKVAPEEKKDVVAVTPVARVSGLDLAAVLKNPRITEKATGGIERHVYVFDVSARANKILIAEAIKAVYKVTPRAVHTATQKPRVVRSARTGKYGKRSGSKKAYVYLNEGDTITIM